MTSLLNWKEIEPQKCFHCSNDDCNEPVKSSFNRSTLLHYACLNGDVEAVKKLTEKNELFIERRDENGFLPIHLACQNGHIMIMKYLIEVCHCSLTGTDSENNMLLHIAALNENIKVIKYIIEDLKCDLDCRSIDGSLPIHCACKSGNISIIKYFIGLLTKDINVTDNYNRTPLHIAAEYGHINVCKYFIEELGCDLNCRDTNGRLPIHYSCTTTSLNLLKYFVCVYNCDSRDNDNRTPLHITALFGNVQAVQYLIEDLGCDVNSRGFKNQVPFYDACVGGHIRVIEYISKLPDCNIQARNSDDRTALHIAALFGHLETVKYLMKDIGCDSSSRGYNYRLPVHDACQNGNLTVIKYLINLQNCDKRDNDNRAPLHVAALFGHLETVQYFIDDLMLDFSVRGYNNRLPIHDACSNGHLNVVKYLINTPNWKAKDGDSRTLLHIAALFGHLELVKYFVENFLFCPSSRGFKGRLPIHDACQNGHLNVVMYFINVQTSDIEARDYDNRTPLHIAAFFGHLEIVKYYIQDYRCHLNYTELPPVIVFDEKYGDRQLVKYDLNYNARAYNDRVPLHSVLAFQYSEEASKIFQDIGYFCICSEHLPLHDACIMGQLHIIKYLVSHQNGYPQKIGKFQKSPLHICSLFGHLQAVKYFTEELEYNPNYRGFHRCLPIHYACAMGHLNIVKYLTEIHNCDPNAMDDFKRTPLHIATLFGHSEIVQYLIEDLGCYLYCKGYNNCLPIHYACVMGNLNVVKYFINVLKCDLNVRDGYNRTPLHIATLFGNLNIVDYFVKDLRCDPNCKGFNESLPIHYACVMGHLNMVKYLIIAHLCEFTLKDSDNRSPLHIAALFGNLEIVKYLIESLSCAPNCRGYKQSLPLHDACRNGHLNVIKYLTHIQSNYFQVTDDNYRTPLHIAALNGHLDVVKYFCDTLNNNPNCRNFHGGLPLHDAVMNGHLDIIKYLILDQHCDLKSIDNYNRTPIHIAAEFGHTDVCKYFIEDMGFPSNCRGFKRQPIHDACTAGHQCVVKYFVTVDKYNLEVRDNNNRTPLHIAARFGHIHLVKYFIENLQCDHNSKGFKRQVLIHDACEGGDLNVIKYISKIQNCNILARNSDDRTVLHIAALFGHLEAVKYLIEDIGCDPFSRGYKYGLPVHDACQTGNLTVIKYLINLKNFDKKDVDISDKRDNDNRTPLHIAALFGHLEIVQFFIEDMKFDSNVKGYNSRLPIHDACCNGHLDVVKYLIDAHNWKAKDGDKRTLLHIAALFGHLELVKYFVEDLLFCIESRGFKKRRPIHDACQNGNLKIINYFINHQSCDPKAKDFNNRTSLHIAAYFGHLEVIKYFIASWTCHSNDRELNFWLPISNISLDVQCMRYCASIQNMRSTESWTCVAMPGNSVELVQVSEDNAYLFGMEEFNEHISREFDELSSESDDSPYNEEYYESDYDEQLSICNNPQDRQIINYLVDSQYSCRSARYHNRALPQHIFLFQEFLNCKKYGDNLPIHDACRMGHLNVIKYFIKSQVSYSNATNSSNTTLLHVSSFFGHLEVVKYFVEDLLCDPNCRDLNQCHPIHYACISGHLNVIKYIISIPNCDLKARDKNNRTVLHIAALFGHLVAVKYFIEELHFKPNSRGHNYRLPIHEACQNGHLSIVKYLMNLQNCHSKAKDHDNRTPLHIATIFGHLEVVRYFVEDCEVTIQNKFNNTALHLAIDKGNFEVVDFFIKRIEFVGQRLEKDLFDDKTKVVQSYFSSTNSILLLAAKVGNLDIFKYICTQCRIDPTLQKNYMNIMHIVKKSEKENFLNFCKNYVDSLHSAAMNDELELVITLIEEKHRSPLMQDRYGNNALHTAAKHGKLRVVRYLVQELHCDPLMKNSERLIAQQLASKNRFVAVESYLFRITSTKPIAKKNSLSFTCCIIVMGNSGAGKSTLIKSIGSKKTLLFSRFFTVKGVLPCTPGIVPCKIENEDIGCVKIYDFAGNEEYYASHEAILQHSKYPFIIVVVNISLALSKIIEQLSFWVTIMSNSKRCRNMNILVVGSHNDRCKFIENRKEADRYMENLCAQISTGLTYHGIVECDCRYSVSSQMKILHSKIASIRKTILFDHVKDESDYLNSLCASLMYQLKHCETDLPPVMKLGKLWHKIKLIETSDPALTQLANKDLLIESCLSLSSSGHLLYFPHQSCPDESLLVLNEEIILGNVHASLKNIREAIANDIGMLAESDLKSILAQSGSMPMTPDMAIIYLIFSQFCTLVSLESLIPKGKLVKGRNIFYFFPNLVKAETPTKVFVDKDVSTDIYTWTLQCNSNQFFTPRCIHNLFIQLVQCEDPDGTVQHDIWRNGILMVNSDSVRSVIEFTDQTTCLKLMMQCHKDQILKLVEERSKLITLIKSVVIKLNPKVETTEYFFLPQSYPLTDFRKIPAIDIAKSIFNKKVGVAISRGRGDTKSIDWHCILDILCFDSVQVIGMPRVEQIFMLKDPDRQVPSEFLSDIISDLQECSALQSAVTRGSDAGLKYTELYLALIKFSVFTKESFEMLSGNQQDQRAHIIAVKSDNLSDDGVQQFSSESLKISDLYAVNLGMSYTSVVKKWKEFGLALGLSDGSLSVIEIDLSGESQRCLTEVLAKWLNGEGSRSTWREAVKATLSLSKNSKQIIQDIPKSMQDISNSSEEFMDVSETQLDNSSLIKLLPYLRDIGHKWFHLGLSLGVPYNSLKNIESEHKDPQRRLSKMLVRWLQDRHDHGSGVASWRRLAIALQGPLVREHKVSLTIGREHPVAVEFSTTSNQ